MANVENSLRCEFAGLLKDIRIPTSDDAKSKIKKYSRINCCIASNLPKSLFRYRTAETHTIDALRNGIISVTKPNEMGDIFDSLIPVNAENVVEKIKQLEGGLDKIAGYLFRSGTIPEWVLQSFDRNTRRFLVKNQHRLKSSQVQDVITKSRPILEKTLLDKAKSKSEQPIEILKKTGYIACFCECGNNLKMWSDYADKHRGYVLEYDFASLNSRFCTLEENVEQFQPNNIVLPVIYGEQYDSTELVMTIVLNELLQGIAGSEFYIKQQDELWHIKGYLYKHMDYAPESEWRLITPIGGCFTRFITIFWRNWYTESNLLWCKDA